MAWLMAWQARHISAKNIRQVEAPLFRAPAVAKGEPMTPPNRRIPCSIRVPERIAATPARAVCAMVFAVALAMSAAAPTARAQDTSLKGLLDRVERLQRDLNTLQRHVYRGEPPPAAASTGGAEVPSTQAARIEVRLSQFETELRALTGQAEEQSFRINQMAQRLDSLVVDLDLRLQALEAGAVGLATDTEEPESAAAAPGAAQPAWDEGPKTLGTVSEGGLAAAKGSGQEAGTPKQQYDHAFDLLHQADYQGAERALAAFLDQYPSDPLAGNAKYWLGETYYVRGQYAEAAVAFAEGYQSYPDSVKAPDNLLKLGKSLAALDQTADACGTFAELLKRYGGAAPTILQQAKSEQKRLSCK
jgi:tol-pal system protein YbgF